VALRIVFFGSPQFAVPSLEALVQDARLSIELVVTQPDRRAGRGRALVAPPVKTAAFAHQIPVWQPETLRSDDALERLRSIDADLYVVVAYGELFQRRVLALPKHGCLNVHPSLLPRYRGSSPIQSAILNGDRETGVTIIQMVRRLDAGPIVAQERVPLDGTETGGSLSARLADLAGVMLPDTAVDWSAGRIEPHPQDDELATYTRELTKASGEIDWTLDAVQIERAVRAYQPWPTAWTTLAGKRLVIERVELSDQTLDLPAGSLVFEDRTVRVACGTGSLVLLDVRPEGKRAMPAQDWFRGLRSSDTLQFNTRKAGENAED
jgi:methionyl-tRNA formyltransferase